MEKLFIPLLVFLPVLICESEATYFDKFVTLANGANCMEKDLSNEGSLLVSSGPTFIRTDGRNTTVIAGSLATGYKEDVGQNAKFQRIVGFVQINKTSVIVSDELNSCLRAIDRISLRTSLFAGMCETSGFAEGIGEHARLSAPAGLVKLLTTLYLADSRAKAIMQINITTKEVKLLATTKGSPHSLLPHPILAKLYVTVTHGVLEINTLTQEIKSLATISSKPQNKQVTFSAPSTAIAWLNNKLMLLFNNNSCIGDFDLNTNIATFIACTNSSHTTSELKAPKSLLVRNNTLFVGQAHNIITTTLTTEYEQNQDPKSELIPVSTELVIVFSVVASFIVVIATAMTTVIVHRLKASPIDLSDPPIDVVPYLR